MALIRIGCAAYWVMLTVLLLLPDPMALVGIEEDAVPAHDRGVHFLFFLGLGFLVRASRWPIRRWALAAGVVLYAILIEGLQHFVPSRSVELLDFGENLLGLAAGAGVWWLLQKKPAMSDPANVPSQPLNGSTLDSTGGNP